MKHNVTPAPLPTNQFVFEKIRSQNMIYVDKTQLIYNMISKPEYYFLSRPRRFGKSLLISTLKHIYLGNREYFKGLWIDQHTDWEWKEWPILLFDFNSISNGSENELKQGLHDALEDNLNPYHIKLTRTGLKEIFKETLIKLHKATNSKIVILVDEYDKPIIDHLDNEEQIQIAKKNRRVMKEFYGVLKDTEIGALIEFFFITGVSKLSQDSVFSELNTLNDLSMDKNYAALLGYTQDELDWYFADWIEQWCMEKNEHAETVKRRLKMRYDGFRFTEAEVYVYNPISILNALKKQSYESYWFRTATPTFLIKLLLQSDVSIPEIEHAELSAIQFDSFEPDNLNIIALMFQTGYLTIKNVIDKKDASRLYSLFFPNIEVKEAFLELLMIHFAQMKMYSSNHLLILNDLNHQRFQLAVDTMQSVFERIPRLDTHDSHFYHHFFYMMIKSACPTCQTIDKTDKMLMRIESKEHQFVINFSCHGSIQELLEQINSRKSSDGDTYKIAIHFDTNQRKIDDWHVEFPKTKAQALNKKPFSAKIYISSTFEDLKDHREAVYKTLRQWGQDVISMEDDVASDARPLDQCLENIFRCDVYIGLFAWRYGYVPPGQEKSITQLEYECARQAGKTCLIFLLHEDADWKIRFMDADRTQIEEFKRKLQTDHMVQFFKTVDDLKAKVSASLKDIHSGS